MVIHRAIFGSLERFIAILIEHYAGAFPAWLSPVQAQVVTVSERQQAYAAHVASVLRRAGFRVQLDESTDEKIGARIRKAELAKTPYTVVVGDKEVEAGAVAPRGRGGRDLGQMPLEAFVALLKEETRVPWLSSD